MLIAEDFYDHAGDNAEDFEDHHGGYGYEIRKKERERILKSFATMNMAAGNTLFKKKESNLVTDESGAAKKIVDCLVKGSQR